LNLANPEVFAKAQDDVMTEIYGSGGHAYPMISYKPLQKSSAFKLYAKSQGLDYETANEITAQIALYEKAVKHADTQEDKDALNWYDFVDEKYHKYLDESKKYQGIINAKSQAPCGYLIYGGDIKREIGLIRCVSGNSDGDGTESKSVITTVIDGMVAENYKFVKNDLLKVDVWLTINKIFEKIGIPTYTVTEITKIIEDDKKTWDIYKNGYTLGVNQMESDFARTCSMRYKPSNMQELTALVSALRPGFKTQLDNFLDRKPYSTGVKELDNLLKDSFHYIMYQENIMTYLGWLGIEQTETYAIIKKISKKKFKEKELAELKAKLIQSWKEHTGTEEGFDKTWEIMEAFSKYALNASHAYSYAYDSVYGAYLKAHYPYEFYSVMMQHLSEKGEKDKVTEYKKEMINLGIKNGDYKFRRDNREFSVDKMNGSINPSLLSIKHFSMKTAEILYELGKQQYNSFADLLETLRLNGLSEARIQDLIKINYFSEFGNINYLEKYFEAFTQFYSLSNKKYLSQYGKEKAFSNNIDYDILRRNCEKETVKTFMGINAKNIINEIMDSCKNVTISSKSILQHRYEVLGYIDIIDKRYKGYCMVTDLNCDYAPKLGLYALANGNTIPVKISKKIYMKNPIKRGDIIKVLSQEKLPKKKRVNGEWTELEEKEWWITDYIIC
jgi:DNA polymerase III alpha subunit